VSRIQLAAFVITVISIGFLVQEDHATWG